METRAETAAETFETWNKVAQLYEEKFLHLTCYDFSYDLLCELIAPDGKLLEVGCGPGNIAKYLLKKCPNLDLTGIDIAPNMVQLAQKNNPQARFWVMDVREIGTLSGAFDAVVAGFCLPYLSAQETSVFFLAVRQLLKNNGLLYLSFVEGEPQKSGFKTSSTGDRVYFYYHTIAALEFELKKYGFKFLHTLKVNYPNNSDAREEHSIVIARLEG